MALKLMYITNDPEVATVAENAGVGRIFVDMEYIGKSARQGGLDTVQSRHTTEDVARIRKTIKKAELLVRCNPIHEATDEYCSTEEEISRIVDAGADLIMLPYFKTVLEVKRFIKAVGGRAKTVLLVETPEAVDKIDEILGLSGIDEIYIGLNDLSLGYGKKFMFELLTDGTVEALSEKLNKKGIPFGFGGIASPGRGLLPAEYIICEHYRLGSCCAILSRSFCNTEIIKDIDTVADIFNTGIKQIRAFEKECENKSDFYINSRSAIERIISKLTES